MKKLFSLLLYLLICINTYAQECLSVIYLAKSEITKPIGNTFVTNCPELNYILANYNIQSFKQARPDGRTQKVRDLYEIMLVNYAEIEQLYEELKNCNYVDDVTKVCIESIAEVNQCQGDPYNDPLGPEGYYVEGMNLHCTWALSHGSPNQIIAIPDVYFDYTHGDMNGKYVSITNVTNFNNNTCSHGFATSGAAAAIVNNNYCVVGSGYNTRVAGYIVGTSCGSGNPRPGIIQAANDGHKIISVSFSGTGLTQTEIEDLVDDGVTLVTSSFNANNPTPDLEGQIHVGQANIDREHVTYFDEFDPKIDIYALSIEVPRLQALNSCGVGSGNTSFGTPTVAGVIALIKAENPCLSPADIENILKSNHGGLPANHAQFGITSGIMDAYQAVLMAQSGFDYIIDQDRTLNADKTLTLFSNVVVKTGVTFTVKGTLRLAKKIIVEGGATLIVDGGTLTKGNFGNGCGADEDNNFWTGVQLGGQGSSSRAYVYFKNGATMEYSYRGCFNSPGAIGYVSVTNSNLLNNRTSIESLVNTSNGMWVLINASKIELNESYPGIDLYHQIRLSCGRAYLTNTTIDNLTPINAFNIAAIQELNSLMFVNSCPKIMGYYFGIDAMGGGSIPYHVTNSVFEKCYIGIRSSGVNNFTIQNNNIFKIDAFGNQSSGIGIELNKGNRFTISGNQFINQNPNQIKSDGIRITDTHPSDENYISKDNLFTRLSRGIYTDLGSNSSGMNDNLYFTCNDFVQCTDDIKLYPGTSINLIQRFGNAAAGNYFSQISNLNNYFNNSNAPDITYWYNSNNPIEFPERRVQVSAFDKERIPTIVRCFQPNPCPESPCDLEMKFFQLSGIIIGLQGQLNQLLDGGQTNYWISQVQTVNDSNSNAIYSELSGLSPNISNQLMITFWQETNSFTIAQRVSLLQANIALIDDSYFRMFFIEHSSDIPTSTVQQILNSIIPNITRVQLARNIRELKIELSNIMNLGLSNEYVFENEDIAGVVNWYNRLQDVSAILDKALYYYRILDFQSAQVTLLELMNQNNLSSYDQNEINSAQSLLDLLRNAFQNNRFEWNLNSSEIENLINIAIDNFNRSGQLARNILIFYYNLDPFNPQYLRQSQRPFPKESLEPSLNSNIKKNAEQFVTLSPNPAKDIVNIYLNENNLFSLTVFNALGKLLYTQNHTDSINRIDFSTSGWDKGVYLIEIKFQNAERKVLKLLIN